jgi:mRNA export factor
MFDIATGQSTQIAQHDEPIKCVRFLDQGNVVATGSWDKTIKYWDLRSPQPVGTVQLPERCYAMDAKGPLMVVGTAEKHVCIFDLNNPTVIFKVNFYSIYFTVKLCTYKYFFIASNFSFEMANSYCILFC